MSKAKPRKVYTNPNIVRTTVYLHKPDFIAVRDKLAERGVTISKWIRTRMKDYLGQPILDDYSEDDDDEEYIDLDDLEDGEI